MTSDIAAYVMLSQFALDQLHRGEDRAFRTAGTKGWRARMNLTFHLLDRDRFLSSGLEDTRQGMTFEEMRSVVANELQNALHDDWRGVFARHGEQIFAVQSGLYVGAAQDGVQILLDEIRLTFLNDQHGTFSDAKALHFLIDERIGDVHDVEWHAAIAEDVAQAEQLERANHGVVHSTLEQDAKVPGTPGNKFVQASCFDKFLRSGPALLDFFLFVEEACGGKDNTSHVAHGLFHGVFERELRSDIVLGHKAPVDMTRTNAQFEHYGRIAGFRQSEPFLDSADNRGQVGARIE